MTPLRNTLVIFVLVVLASVLWTTFVPRHRQMTCDCGSICVGKFHCGLKSCPHGR